MLAHELGATLYADYDPTTPADNLRSIMADYADETRTLVVAYEECDVSLERIARKQVSAPPGYRLDASDKASWNALIDTLRRRTNVVLVMTTNRSMPELRRMCDDSGSMLRRGRVDCHVVMEPGRTPVVLEADTFLEVKEVKEVHEVDSDSSSSAMGPATPSSKVRDILKKLRINKRITRVESSSSSSSTSRVR